MKEQIIQAIEAYIKSKTFKNGIFTEFEDAELAKDFFAEKHANQLYTAIAPYLAGNTGKCKCGSEGMLLHACPYKEDVHGDIETACNCCDKCKQNCIDDI